MNILSIQSWVSYGHVGNAAALFPLQRLGAEVWTIDTVQFSNHPGYGSHAGRVAGGEAVAELLDGLKRLGVCHRLDALLSGYMGDAGAARAVLDALPGLRAERPDLIYACDPVLGDHGPGLYVAASLAELLRDEAVACADILTPNRFELDYLLGLEPEVRPDLAVTIERARVLGRRMRAEGPGLVLVSSVEMDGRIGLLLVTRDRAWRIATDRLPIETNGAGDLLSALFLFHLLDDGEPVAAFERAVSSVWCVLARTAERGEREPALVAAQQELVAPFRRFAAEPV